MQRRLGGFILVVNEDASWDLATVNEIWFEHQNVSDVCRLNHEKESPPRTAIVYCHQSMRNVIYTISVLPLNQTSRPNASQ